VYNYSTSNPERDKRTTMAEDNPFAPRRIDYAPADPVLGFLGARASTSLNGTWRVIVDPMGVGDPGSMFGGFPRNKRQRTGMELVEYDFESAQTCRVPGDFNTQDEHLFFYQGRVWYYRTFTAPMTNGVRQHLHFGGANYNTTVFLNGNPVGEHRGGYVPFSFDVTDALRPGENVLLVRVDNSLSADSVPTARTDWWPYGGLTRDVALVETPVAFIRNARITLTDRDNRTIAITTETEGFSDGAKVLVRLPEAGVEAELVIEADANGTGIGTMEINAAVQLWSPEFPKRYEVAVSAGDDHVVERVGFRTIETRGTEILLNGEPIKLRGISTHEEPIGEPGVAYSADHARRSLEEAKALNANFVRAAHYPYSRHMAETADELGIMLWEEVPVYWNIAWKNPETLAIARDQIDRLVRRDWNRASVIIWSVANETPLSEPRMTFLKRLIDDVRALDDSRLVSAALLGGGRQQFAEIVARIAARSLDAGGLSPADETVFKGVLAKLGDAAPGPDDDYTVMIDDPLGELTDVVAYNQYFGWYYSAFFSAQLGVGEDVLRPRMLELMRDMRIRATVDKPVHISEFGAGAKHGRRGGEALIWTEEYQAQVYQAQIEMLRNSPQVQGLTPWILKDFRAMLRPLAGVQDYFNRKGLIDENGQRKLAFDVLREFYAGSWAEGGDL
jgi:beta-glucuronidase